MEEAREEEPLGWVMGGGSDRSRRETRWDRVRQGSWAAGLGVAMREDEVS